MLILNAEDVKKALPMDQTIVAMKSAYAALASNQAEIPVRSSLAVRTQDASQLLMPAHVSEPSNPALTLKVVSLFPNNLPKNLPMIHAAVLVFDPETGCPTALLEGGTLTAIRTGAASGAATDLLARPAAKTAAIFGASVQGRTQLEAICAIRKIETVWVVDLSPDRVQTFIAEMAGVGNIPTDLRPAATPEEAIRQADIICTATTAKTPVYPAEAVRPGTHINGVGSYTLAMIENPPELYTRAAGYVDSIPAILAEAGETVAAIQKNFTTAAGLTELGDVILGKKPGRTAPDQITFFKSVGVAVQDALAAQLALENATRLGLGQQVNFIAE